MTPLKRSVRVMAVLAVATAVLAGGVPRSAAGRVADVARRLSEAKARLAATDAALAQAGGMLAAADGRFGAIKQRLARQAVNAYVHGGSVALVEQLARSSGQDLSLRNQYVSMAAG